MAEAERDTTALPAKPRVVVGLDFGTTYSGFAFAHVSDPDKIYSFYDYPKGAGEKPYCKTLTACYYKPVEPVEPAEQSAGVDQKGSWRLQSWGYPARTDFECDIQALHKYRKSQDPPTTSAGHRKPAGDGSSHGVQTFPSTFEIFGSPDVAQPSASTVVSPVSHPPTVGVFLSRFKLHLASRSNEASTASPLPPGLAIEQVITDYLRELGGLILKHLQSKYGAHFSSELIQWCITVPSIWDNSAKATMKRCMEAAGLVSPHHPVVIVLEPEAASFHCQRLMGEIVLQASDKLLVADMGGGTSDIVVQEVVKPGCSVKEVTMSSGGLCGGTYVDSRFMEFLKGRVGQACVSECILKHRNVYGQLMKEWECTKSSFEFGQGVTTMNLPNKLAVEWERSDTESGHPGSQEYDELEISYEEMQAIFDPVVQQNVDLIEQQMVEAGGKVRVLVLVGGFSESPYLLHWMKEAFGARAESIICPPNPGGAICQGAVALALNPKAVVSRICKRTYGYRAWVPFEREVDPIECLETHSDGTQWCHIRFEALVKKGDVVVMDKPVTTFCCPLLKGCTSVGINLFSCDDNLPPRYTTDKRMQKEGNLVMDISGDMKLETRRSIELSLCFGGTCLEVRARAVNFKAEKVELPVEVDYLLH